MYLDETTAERDAILATAKRMCVAARTAPKTRGVDHIVTAILTEEDKDRLAIYMRELGTKYGMPFFAANGQNVLDSTAVILIGTKEASRGLSACGFCGFKDCIASAKNGGHCAYDDIDLGIAIGSAVSIAADDRIDNRIMFSIGRAAMELQLLGEDITKILGIPLSATGKDIYFDR